jgi:hypothetical protein
MIESVQEGAGFVLPAGQEMEDCQAPVSQHTRTDRTLRWFTASTTRGKRLDQSLPRLVSSRMPGIATGHQAAYVVS